MDWNIGYGELAEEAPGVVNKYECLKSSLMNLQEILDEILPMKQHYNKMTLAEKIEFDLLIAYIMNSLQWVQLRILGIDPNTHPIKFELNRVKTAMIKWHEVKDNSKRPTVDVKAAKRFIRSGLYDSSIVGQQQNKKIKFSDDQK